MLGIGTLTLKVLYSGPGASKKEIDIRLNACADHLIREGLLSCNDGMEVERVDLEIDADDSCV